ncbi:MAG TPA: hypothetical protein VFV87_01745, partial [Pirellulaceae bacterium]|nr:hypothetical protein [Pirellulaceae bacterium]
MHDWLAEQTRRNLAVRGQWQAFESHRQRVTALLAEVAGQHRRSNLCLLGAGNCNDVNLQELIDCYEALHLVDCDGDALARGIERQGLGRRPSLTMLGEIDLLGLADCPPSATSAELAAAALNHQPLQNFKPVEVVASLCVLSQLLEAAASRCPSRSASHLELLQAVRYRHLRLLVELLRPGGCGLLITDLVSSVSARDLDVVGDEQLPALVSRWVSEHNFFTGLNPAVVLASLQDDPWMAAHVKNVQPLGPWKWDLG